MKAGISWKLLPYILLVIYVIFVSYTFYTLEYRLNYLLNHPVNVLQHTRDIRARIGELQYTLPGLMATPDLSYKDVISVLESQESLQKISFEKIKEHFSGSTKLVDNLHKALMRLFELRHEAAESLIGNDDYIKSMSVYKRLIDPQVRIVRRIVDDISGYSQNVLIDKKIETEKDVVVNVLITIIMGIFITLAFAVVSRQEEKKTRLLEDRERLFNQLSQNVDEIFIIASNDHVFEYCTTNSKRLINIDSQELIENPDLLYDSLPPEDTQWLKHMLEGEQKHESVEEHTVIVDNGSRVFRINIYPIRDSRGERAIVAIQDKTIDFQQQQALGDALENAHAASIAKSSFLSHMSHEIRTPMNAIIGMTTIALSKINNQERVQDCLGKIAESSRHLLRLINDVLDMSKIENGKLVISHEPFSLPAAIQNVNNLVRPQAEDRELNFDIFQENVDEEDLVGDPLRLNQILLNILSNSLKFTPAGGTITLKVKQLKKKNDSVRLAFILSDTGIGMSQEFLTRLYTPFEQASSTTTAKYGGTGLGMSITFNLITLMGGTIHVESKEGAGTTFTVELPFEYDKTTGDHHSDTLPRLKVLVVDDDHDTCEHASLLLEKMGLTVQWCTSGLEAVEKVREAHDAAAAFDVCFVDWQMPEMDGAEAAKRIREVAGEDMLIIIISAYDWSPIEEKAKSAGVNDFVAKPFFASTLYNALISTTQRYGMLNIPEQTKGKESYDFTGKRILLVEDNEFNREIGEEFLEMVNATVENAENGKEAVEKFTASEPGYYDLILMDVQMPIMDGYEATKTIRASDHPDAKTIHILAMTANAFSEDVANAISCGMNGHIAKPIDINDLYRQIYTHTCQTGGASMKQASAASGASVAV